MRVYERNRWGRDCEEERGRKEKGGEIFSGLYLFSNRFSGKHVSLEQIFIELNVSGESSEDLHPYMYIQIPWGAMEGADGALPRAK